MQFSMKKNLNISKFLFLAIDCVLAQFAFHTYVNQISE